MDNEDFAYNLAKEKSSGFAGHFARHFDFAKKPLKVISLIASIVFFALITISAYYFTTRGQSGQIEIVKSPDFEIKTRNKIDYSQIKNIDKTIYENIIGNKVDDLENRKIKIVESPQVAIPENPVRLDFGNNSSWDNDLPDIDTKIAKNLPNQPLKNAEIVDPNAQKLAAQDRINSPKTAAIQSQKTAENNKETVNPKKTKSYARVQLSALKSEESAYQYWLNLKKQYPAVFSSVKYFIEKVDLGNKGIFYRLQVGNFRNQVDAEEFCIKFVAKTGRNKSECIIVE